MVVELELAAIVILQAVGLYLRNESPSPHAKEADPHTPPRPLYFDGLGNELSADFVEGRNDKYPKVHNFTAAAQMGLMGDANLSKKPAWPDDVHAQAAWLPYDESERKEAMQLENRKEAEPHTPPQTLAELHQASEAAAIEAEQAFREGNIAQASLLYAKAAEFEQQALGSVDGSKARTRGITAISAVSLWYKAASYERAEQLAYSMLADSSIPPFARADLRNLVQAIWTESSKKNFSEFDPNDPVVSLKHARESLERDNRNAGLERIGNHTYRVGSPDWERAKCQQR